MTRARQAKSSNSKSALCQAAVAGVAMLTLPGPMAAGADQPAAFVGARACTGCHTAQFDAWKGSHHALAMQTATTATVLGDFSDAKLEHFGVTTTFYRDGEKFIVRADGPDGALHDYPIAYTFGVYPLQQYLIAFPGGRLQALGIAWDSRPKDQGGQHWFELYPGQQLKPGDPVHWTGRDQTWNYRCADCHFTDLKKNYDLAANSYATSWNDLDVDCEACHGPAHSRVSTELETCAACLSRRKAIASNPTPGASYLDEYLPALLESRLYYADGQNDGEVYEYGSFQQSRMYAAGVTRGNCHDPHSAKLRAEGNARHWICCDGLLS
jgi:hypothetical protein